MKVTVLGAGAVGAMLGGLIKRGDPTVDILLIARGEHARRMQEAGGVKLLGPWGELLVPARVSRDVADLAGSEYVLLTVKSQMTEETIRQAAPYLGDAVVISVQNGINQAVLAKHVRPDRLFVGMTAANMALTEPGSISLQRGGVTVVGPYSADIPEAVVRRVVSLLGKSGLRMESSRNIVGVQYNKLLMNTMGYASVLSGSDFVTEGVLYRPWRRAVAFPILEEGLSVLGKAGIRLERTPGISDVLRFRRLLHAFDLPAVDTLVRWVLTTFFRRWRLVYSVYQDLVRKRKTEIDFVNGQIVRLAEEHGGKAPYNALVVQLVRQLEERGDGTFFSRDEVIAKFSSLPFAAKGGEAVLSAVPGEGSG